jgi:septum formation protein
MYTRWLPLLNKSKIILASGSAQRQKFLSELGFIFEINPSDFPENLEKTNPKDYVKQTSEKKFEYFIEKNKELSFDILITADTIIEHNGIILEKPQDEKDVNEWLQKYSNDKVVCYTSVVVGVIRDGKVKSRQFISQTDVYFDDLDSEIISDYIKTGQYIGKAGGFSIQGLAKTFIKKIDGCYDNVVGFPVNDFIKNLLILLKEVYGQDGWKI